MSAGRIGVIALVLVVFGGAWAGATLGGDGGPSPVETALLENARTEDQVGLQDVADEDDAAGGPDPTGDGTLDDDGTRGGNNGGDNSRDRDRTAGNDGTNGGDNTGDGDRTAGNDGTSGGDNTYVPAPSGGSGGGDSSGGGGDT